MPKPMGVSQVASAFGWPTSIIDVRVPAALISGLSVAGLFVAIPQGKRGKRAHEIISTVYIALLAVAVVLHLTCCFVSTAAGAHTSLLLCTLMFLTLIVLADLAMPLLVIIPFFLLQACASWLATSTHTRRLRSNSCNASSSSPISGPA